MPFAGQALDRWTLGSDSDGPELPVGTGEEHALGAVQGADDAAELAR